MNRNRFSLGLIVCCLTMFICSEAADEHEHEHILPHGHWFIDKIFLQFSDESSNYSFINKSGLKFSHIRKSSSS